MIDTRRLTLRPWQASDLVFLQGLRNDAPLQALLLANARGSDLAAVRAWLAGKSLGEDRLFFVIALSHTHEPIGYIQLSDEAGATLTMRFGICLAREHCAQGYGTESLRALEDFLRDHRGTHKLMLHVDAANKPAVQCYVKLAYREVGTMQRHVLVQDRLRDVVIMEKWLSPAAGDAA